MVFHISDAYPWVMFKEVQYITKCKIYSYSQDVRWIDFESLHLHKFVYYSIWGKYTYLRSEIIFWSTSEDTGVIFNPPLEETCLSNWKYNKVKNRSKEGIHRKHSSVYKKHATWQRIHLCLEYSLAYPNSENFLSVGFNTVAFSSMSFVETSPPSECSFYATGKRYCISCPSFPKKFWN